ncbi:MAG: anthranilate phosphoribosyltransferase [Elusimicrobiota bacterium]
MQEAVAKLVEGRDLSLEESRSAMAEIFTGEAPASRIAAFLTALRMKGETVEVIAGCAEAMRGAAAPVRAPAGVTVDTCGTGGDKKGSFNVSTAAAFVVAGAGFTVAKHGNRSVSSQCGSADVLEALGVKVDPGVAVVEKCLQEAGIAFLFAPAFHPAMKHAMPVRRELGLRTVFNVLGPLCNPAGVNAQVIGVFSPKLVDVMAKVLARLGARHAMVVHGGGHDEIILSGTTLAAEIVEGRIRRRTLSPRDFGLRPVPKGALLGGDKEKNADILRRILAGEKGPQRDAVAANAAAAILTASRAAGRADVKNLKDARMSAEKALDSGAARNKLERLAALSQGGA